VPTGTYHGLRRRSGRGQSRNGFNFGAGRVPGTRIRMEPKRTVRRGLRRTHANGSHRCKVPAEKRNKEREDETAALRPV
jgi:hypothetical protein